MKRILLLLLFAACSKANGDDSVLASDALWADHWMQDHCVTTMVEAHKKCSFCQGEAPPYPKARAARVAAGGGMPADYKAFGDLVRGANKDGWGVVVKRLESVSAIERGVTYCQDK